MEGDEKEWKAKSPSIINNQNIGQPEEMVKADCDDEIDTKNNERNGNIGTNAARNNHVNANSRIDSDTTKCNAYSKIGTNPDIIADANADVNDAACAQANPSVAGRYMRGQTRKSIFLFK